ncbi:zinc-ribbon domain-containing protein [Cuniculiplasma sp. SKW3]|uniref:zinc-ribbon domain-containing protein n=1 Tax=Cuniculiplasma sp. SKW3 TaxID=3400170 RepID=UPI003FD43505
MYEENKSLKKSDLGVIVNNPYTLTKLLEGLSEEGFINYEVKEFGRKSYSISLTEKGRKVAEQLKKAEEIANSPSVEVVPKSDLDLTMTEEEAEMAKHLNLLFHINVMDDHITVEEVKPGKPPRIFNIYVKRNGNGEFRLWCEHDDSYDCWHVKAAWTYPHVQKMMMHYKGKVKVCPACGYENPEVAKFCMNCGVKLE